MMMPSPRGMEVSLMKVNTALQNFESSLSFVMFQTSAADSSR